MWFAFITILIVLSLVSVNHIKTVAVLLAELPVSIVGLLSWSGFILVLLISSRGFVRKMLFVALLFGLAGFVTGPYLEPPGDPLEHLRRVHENFCGQEIQNITPLNRGLIHYSMLGNIICLDKPVEPEKMLFRLDLANGLFWALAAASLFILARKAGLDDKWSFLSVVIAFLFFGSNRLSFFRYYSFGPVLTSMCMLWLWTACFFFKRKSQLLLSTAVALLLLPILLVNHIQEAVFLCLLLFFYFLLQLVQSSSLIFCRKEELDGKLIWSYISCFLLLLAFLFLWVAPQFSIIREWLFANISIKDISSPAFGVGSKEVVFNSGNMSAPFSLFWQGLYLGGDLSARRVKDTLGGAVFCILFFAVPYLWLKTKTEGENFKRRILFLALFPLIVYFIPLLHFVWSVNVWSVEYFRLCYLSMFWLFWADLFSVWEYYGRRERVLQKVANE